LGSHFDLYAKGTNLAQTSKTYFDLICLGLSRNAVRSDCRKVQNFGNHRCPLGGGDKSAGGCDSGSLMPGLPLEPHELAMV
jgi:hypothetical protein